MDPCCGNGNFPAYLSFKIDISKIWMNELSQVRYENAKALLNPKHIFNNDFFDFSLGGETFDLVIGNPPYSGGGNKNRSLSNRFIERSIDIINPEGYLCFITPNNWMTYNNNNTTLKKLLNEGSFLLIDNDVKRYFPKVGSSFTVFIWQKGVFNNKTTVFNNYLIKDKQVELEIPSDLDFIPLYLSETTISLAKKIVGRNETNQFKYRCDLHNFTQKSKLSDYQTDEFKYKTIHTVNKTRYSNVKQDIFDKYIVIVPLSTYFLPYVASKMNVTQSVGFIEFESKKEAESAINLITSPWFKLIIHLTRYGNFNNIKVLKNMDFFRTYQFNKKELEEINLLAQKIKY